MKYIQLIFAIGTICGCTPPDPHIYEVTEADIRSLESGKVIIPDTYIDWWEQTAPRCSQGLFPSKTHDDGRCDDGDATLFNGLLCFSGYEKSCQTVAEAQDLNGRWWRSPRKEDLNRERNSFSRDQTVGVLLYLTKTKNTVAAQRWMSWMEENRKCFLNLPFGGGCAIKATVTCNDSDDATCVLSPNLWSLLHKVWSHMDLDPSFRMERPYSELGDLSRIIKPLKKEVSLDKEDLALMEADMVKVGYRLHLKGVQLLLKDALGPRTPKAQMLANLLYHKQPNNLFFQYLAEGPSQNLANLLMEQCPMPGHLPAVQNQWAWERADNDRAWERSIGWDCFFLGRLLVMEGSELFVDSKAH